MSSRRLVRGGAIVAFAALAAVLGACQSPDPAPQAASDARPVIRSPKFVTLEDAASRIVLSPGGSVDVRLAGDRTTGEQWKLVGGTNESVSQRGNVWFGTRGDPRDVHASVNTIFTLQAKKPGSAGIDFAYARIDRPDDPGSRRAHFDFTVE